MVLVHQTAAAQQSQQVGRGNAWQAVNQGRAERGRCQAWDTFIVSGDEAQAPG